VVRVPLAASPRGPSLARPPRTRSACWTTRACACGVRNWVFRALALALALLFLSRVPSSVAFSCTGAVGGLSREGDVCHDGAEREGEWASPRCELRRSAPTDREEVGALTLALAGGKLTIVEAARVADPDVILPSLLRVLREVHSEFFTIVDSNPLGSPVPDVKVGSGFAPPAVQSGVVWGVEA